MKRKTKIQNLVLMSLISLGLQSCNDSSSKNSLEDKMNQVDESGIEISQDEIFSLIESSSTPIEMAMVIKNSNYEFSKDLILSTDNIERFSTSYEKATAMGAYGADIGFLNIYNKLHILPDYLMVIRELSKDLDLDSFFDFQTMLDLSENIENVDSLIQMSTESFNEMEAYLREQGRDEISLLIVFGTWLEGTNLIADFSGKNNDREMMNRVAEQKNFVLELYRIVQSSSDSYFKGLSKDLKPLVELFNKVELEEILKEPTILEEDGQMIIIDNSELNIIADKGVIDNIIKEVKALRNKLIK